VSDERLRAQYAIAVASGTARAAGEHPSPDSIAALARREGLGGRVHRARGAARQGRRIQVAQSFVAHDASSARSHPTPIS